jgi:hypothetical protein
MSESAYQDRLDEIGRRLEITLALGFKSEASDDIGYLLWLVGELTPRVPMGYSHKSLGDGYVG